VRHGKLWGTPPSRVYSKAFGPLGGTNEGDCNAGSPVAFLSILDTGDIESTSVLADGGPMSRSYEMVAPSLTPV